MLQLSVAKGGKYCPRNQESGRVPAVSQTAYLSKVDEENLKIQQFTKGYRGYNETNNTQWNAEGTRVAFSRAEWAIDVDIEGVGLWWKLQSSSYHHHHYSCWGNKYLNLIFPQNGVPWCHLPFADPNGKPEEDRRVCAYSSHMSVSHGTEQCGKGWGGASWQRE